MVRVCRAVVSMVLVVVKVNAPETEAAPLSTGAVHVHVLQKAGGLTENQPSN